MYPGHWARTAAERPAVIDAESGAAYSYADLDADSLRFAHWLQAVGVTAGGHVAVFMENRFEFYAAVWACFRSGLYVTCINRYFTAPEAAYVLDDCEADVLVASSALPVARELPALATRCQHFVMAGSPVDGWLEWAPLLATQSAEEPAEQPRGDYMLYSSGTTGRPKGILRPLTGESIRNGTRASQAMAERYGLDEDTVYLSPAPLYHAAPLAYNLGVQANGGTCVMMKKFDAEAALAAIERYRVTHSQWVPTMFVRMLKLDEAARTRHDLSSHRVAIHAAAPCPVKVKQAMIEWWGPILYEYYAGTEGNGSTFIDSHDWLAHPGSVGRAVNGVLHICAEDGTELPPGEAGTVYFEMERMPFAYHNAPDKTRSAQHPIHPNWSSLGDIGYVDEEGFLYLTDRKAYMIISGGVNIYPQQVEDALVLHPDVHDVAVFGIPNDEFGEEVKAVVQLAPGLEGSDARSAELIAYAREHLAHYMVPRSIDYIDEMPRLPTGKLYKRLLRDRYLGKEAGTIV
jgi:long-chain acyl-CoA synthetase